MQPLLSQKSPAAAAGREQPSQSDAPSAAALESQLEQAVYEALRRPREPVVISRRFDFLHELDRRMASFSIGSRFAAAIGVSAVVALFFVFLVPASHDFVPPAESGSPGLIQSMRAALNEPSQGGEDGKPALCELQNVLGVPQSQAAMSHEQSDTLLQQFMQWRQKPQVAKAQ
jgi:hypothetical protein